MSSPLLILLPGMDGTGELFKDFIASLPKTVSTRTVEFPATECLSYQELMSHVAAVIPASEPFVLMAESFSTPLAIKCAAFHPHLKGVILSAGFACNPIPIWLRWTAVFATPRLFARKLPKPIVELLLLGRNAPASLVNRVQSVISSVDPTVLSERLNAVVACDVRTELRQLSVPILYIQAKNDRLVSPSSLKTIRKIKPGIQISIVDAPHLLVQREPLRIAKIVATFLADTLG